MGDVVLMLLINLKLIPEVSTVKESCSHKSTTKFQFLDGAKMLTLEKNTGLEETHGELTGEKEDSSESRWDQKILLLRLIALLQPHPSRSITLLKKKLLKNLKISLISSNDLVTIVICKYYLIFNP